MLQTLWRQPSRNGRGKVVSGLPACLVWPSRYANYGFSRYNTVALALRPSRAGYRISICEREPMKHRIVHFLQKYLFNPPIRFLLAIGIAPSGYALLETKGRKTGKPRRTPVGNGRVGNQFWIVAEHGEKASYIRNIEVNPRVRLKLRNGLRVHWHTGTAKVLSEDDPHERQRWLAKELPGSASNAAAVRFFSTQLLTVRIDLDA